MRLGELVKVLSGFAFDSTKFNDHGGGIQLVRIRDVGKDYSETYYSGEYDNRFVLNNGDFLIGMDGDFRLAVWKGGAALLNQRVCKISVAQKDLWGRYLYYFLPKELKKIEDSTSYATVKHLSTKKIEAIDIPLTPLETQKKIAAILDKADELRQNDKKILEKYDQLAQSIFLEMFGDPVRNEKGWMKQELLELCSKITDGTHKTPKYVSDGIKFLSAKNIKSRYIDDCAIKFISSNEHNDLIKRSKPEFGDILFTKSGSIGMAALNELPYEFSIFESLALIKYHRRLIEGKFLWAVLNSPQVVNHYLSKQKGVGVKHFHLTDINKIQIILPPIELQRRFSLIMRTIETQIQLTGQSLKKSDELFQSLLQRAFRGELV